MISFTVLPTHTKEYMAKQTVRRRKDVAAPSPFDQARDEMFQHIMQCGVIGADPEHKAEWFTQTVDYLADRYHELSASELRDLRTLGERFSQPPSRAAQQSEAAETPSADADGPDRVVADQASAA